ncbi:ParM/StbA family protein [Lusitaniella coriacea]|uniref:ParM/StbA family protein n=1 Tax=Lusitaniella coriacea TaxID=1983105 RepID=UPI003CE6E62E
MTSISIKPDLVVALDFGGSYTKGFYASDRGLSFIGLEPEVVSLPRSAIEAYEANKLAGGKAEDEAWLGRAGEYYAVGSLARRRFSANAGLSDLKAPRGVIKTLAVLGILQQRLELTEGFRVALTVVLPPGEYADRTNFERELRAAIAEWETPTGRASAELADFNCKPEGAGVYMCYRNVAGESIYRQNLAAVMLGYRNTSTLVSERGIVTPGRTSDLGMQAMIRAVMERTAGLNEPELVRAIATAGDAIDPQPLWHAGRSRAAGRPEEIARLVEVVRACRAEYVARLSSWLEEVLPSSFDALLLSGGTGDYLRGELMQMYPHTPLIWHGNLEVPESLDPLGMGSRLADIYGIFQYYLSVWGKAFLSRTGVE